MSKLIITAAVTGSFATREENPYIPYTTREIADEAIRAWEAGASIIHLHMRKDDGTPVADPERFYQTIQYIREKSDVIINTTTGGAQSQGATADDRLAVVPRCKPELATLDIGSHMGGSRKNGQWVGDRVGGLTFSQLHHYADVMRECGTKPEIEIFDSADIHATSLLIEAGALTPPLQFGLVLGMAGQRIPASARNLQFLVEALPPDSPWTCMAIGKYEFSVGTVAIAMGGHVRVGFEDNVYLSKGVLAKSNAELVEKMVRIARLMGREIATPGEAREMLGLGGKR